mmetsp:Transcript_1571/g.4634  ORF Transcript_1571/g.4634 Transcript_1571/m.4634 type:complete len:262 (+) Transcript_1571:2498-3283(+)
MFVSEDGVGLAGLLRPFFVGDGLGRVGARVLEDALVDRDGGLVVGRRLFRRRRRRRGLGDDLDASPRRAPRGVRRLGRGRGGLVVRRLLAGDDQVLLVGLPAVRRVVGSFPLLLRQRKRRVARVQHLARFHQLAQRVFYERRGEVHVDEVLVVVVVVAGWFARRRARRGRRARGHGRRRRGRPRLGLGLRTDDVQPDAGRRVPRGSLASGVLRRPAAWLGDLSGRRPGLRTRRLRLFLPARRLCVLPVVLLGVRILKVAAP